MTPVVKLILIILIPWIAVFFALRQRTRFRLFAFVGVFAVQLLAIAPMAYIAASVTGQPQDENLQLASMNHLQNGLLPYRSGEAPQPLNELHSRGGEWSGRDYTRPCGTSIIAPFDGSVTRGGQGIKDSWDNTYMYIKSADGRYEMLIMHSDFLLSAGDNFQQGQEIGKTNTHGYSSECHEHISLRVNGTETDPENYRNRNGNTIYASVVSMTSADYPLRISWYDPSLGGTNCDGDCTTMASGDKVASWIGGRGGIYAAACPRSDGWHHGLRFELDGTIYECRDTGGWINCYQPGQLDRAIQNAHSEGYLLDIPVIADQYYCWVDLLNNSTYGYGNLAHNWSMVR